jgi:hypothetical protein
MAKNAGKEGRDLAPHRAASRPGTAAAAGGPSVVASGRADGWAGKSALAHS